ncbi:MAG: hypothetical protein RMY36_030985 [Nostoc sp. SerVER01]|nr:hypothetical protein [Nostoc sp. SerVER01]
MGGKTREGYQRSGVANYPVRESRVYKKRSLGLLRDELDLGRAPYMEKHLPIGDRAQLRKMQAAKRPGGHEQSQQVCSCDRLHPPSAISAYSRSTVLAIASLPISYFSWSL